MMAGLLALPIGECQTLPKRYLRRVAALFKRQKCGKMRLGLSALFALADLFAVEDVKP